jgi:Carboxypeptidase regulatory-like domain
MAQRATRGLREVGTRLPTGARLGRLVGALRAEAGIGLIEAVIAMALFLIASTALTDVLSSSVNSHGFTFGQTLAQEAADAQIELVRALPYDSVGTVSGNPPGSVVASESATALGITGLNATVATSIHYVGDGIPGGYNNLTNYKQIVVTVTRNSDSRELASESTYMAPPARAPYGGINEVALGVTVTDIGDNLPLSGVGIALGGGPSAPRSDTTDTNGSVLFAGMTANTTSGPQQYYTATATPPPGYVEVVTGSNVTAANADVTQASLNPGQVTTLHLRVYQPESIIVNLTSGGSTYGGSATVTLTPPPTYGGSPTSYTVTGGAATIANLIPGQYSLSASTASGLVASTVSEAIPTAYPSLTSTVGLDLEQATGTLTVNAVNGANPIAGANITVTGGPNGVTLTGTTDANGVVNFPSIAAGSTPYTVSGTYGAQSFSQAGVTVPINGTKNVTLGISAGTITVTAVPGATLTLTGPNGFSEVQTLPVPGSGVYTFANVGAGGGYSVTAADGNATAQKNGITVSSSTPYSWTAPLQVGTVNVTVTDGTNPVSGAAVTLTGPNSLSETGVTDGTGTWSFTNIGAGSACGCYSVSVTDGPASAQKTGLNVAAIPPGTATTVALTLPVGSIQATVTAGGTPVAGAAVVLTGPNGYTASGTTNSSGVSTFAGLGAGSGYTVSASEGSSSAQQTGVSVSAGSPTPVALAIPVGSVQVTVDAGSSALPGATVNLSGPSGYSAAAGTTNGSGVYTFLNVPVGSGFTASTTGGAGTAVKTGLSVTPGNQTAVTLTIPAGSIKATVNLGGNPLANQTVQLTGPGSFSTSGTTSAAGIVIFSSVPSGTGYTVATTDGQTVQQSGLTVATGGTTNVSLNIQAGSLQVTVKLQSGTTVQGATVTLASTNGVTAAPGTTAANGTYTFSNLPTGTGVYTVTASDGGGSVTSASQTVNNLATTNVTVTIPTGTIQVTVKDQGGTGLQNASLTLSGPNSFTASGTTVSGGTFSFTNVPQGAGYSIAATDGAGSGSAASISVTSSPTPASITIQTGTISGTLTGGGSGLAGAAVTLTGPNGFTASGTTSGSTGSFSFPNVPIGGGYTVSAVDGAGTAQQTGVSVSSGTTTNVPLTMPVGMVKITTLKNSGPTICQNVTVTLTGPNSFSTTSSPTTSPSGSTTIANVPAGSGYTATVNSHTLSNITVTSGGTATGTLNLNGGCS